jgi:predicted DNA-binding transcriptional regulator YafY
MRATYGPNRTGLVRFIEEDGAMLDTSARLLRLLSLLQRRTHWNAPELAERLGVTTRTVRRDVDRLRDLGYPVEASRGTAGGYQLGTSGDLPPLLLDDDEAIAIAVALGVTAGGAAAGNEPALAALAKLHRLLPPRLRQRVSALRASTVTLAPLADGVDTDLLVTLAQACDGDERVALDYRDRQGRRSDRRIEPYRLVATGRRWYLVAFDLDRRAWRTFRLDRVREATRTGHRFARTEHPDAAELVSQAISTAPYQHQASVAFPVPADELRRRIPPTVGVVQPDGTDGCRLMVGADDLDSLAGHLISLGLPFEVVEPVELRHHVAALGRRLAAAHPDAP